MIRRLVVLAALTTLPLTGAAAPPSMQSAARADVEFVTGGVGIEERELLARADYNLKIATAAAAGNWLADAEVAITDPQGMTLVLTRMDGPWLLAKLPPGTYQVTVRYGGDAQRQAVVVPAAGRREVVFRWRVAEDLGPTRTEMSGRETH
jgi:hypothetical protein